MKLLPEKTIEFSFATRLCDLLDEQKKQRKELYSFVAPNTVTKWCDKNNPINPDKIIKLKELKEVADYLNVDVEYLLCKQIKKRKCLDNMKFEEWNNKISPKLKIQLELWESSSLLKDYFKMLGYLFQSSPISSEEIEDEYQEIVRKDDSHFMLLTFVQKYASETKYSVSVFKDGILRGNLSEVSFYDFLDSIKSHISCEIERIAKKTESLE